MRQIREYKFLPTTPGSLAGGSAFSFGYTDQSIVGEIISVGFKGNMVTGSLFLLESGTNQLIWGAQTGSSPAFVTAYPTVATVDNTNTSLPAGSGLTVTNRVTLGPLFLGGSGANGGSVPIFIVRYEV